MSKEATVPQEADFVGGCQDLSTNTFVEVLECVRDNTSFFCDQIFNRVITFDTETIQWDHVYSDMAMAPWVCPCVQAPNMPYANNWDSQLFKPAYIKIKSTMECCKPLPTGPGERCWGDLSLQERYERHAAEMTRRQDQSITRREEYTAAQALIHAKYDVEGELYPKATVDFKRSPNLEWKLTGAQKWGKESCDALGTLQCAYDKVFCESNAQITDVMMSPATCLKLKQSQDIADCIKNDNVGRVLSFSGPLGDQTPRPPSTRARLEFNIGGVNFWCVNEWYETCDEKGRKCRTPFIPDGKVVGMDLSGSPCSLQPIKLYGAIMDCDVLQPLQRYTKSWTQHDPSARFLMTQSAPLPVVLNANASFCMTVCAPEDFKSC